MKKKILILLSYIIIFFNSNLLSEENNKILKVGLLAPLTGEYKELGNSLLYSLQLALNEIGDDKVFIIPRDSGFKDKDKALYTIRKIRKRNKKYQINVIATMLGRAKKHPYKTKQMKEAIKVFSVWMKNYKKLKAKS